MSSPIKGKKTIVPGRKILAGKPNAKGGFDFKREGVNSEEQSQNPLADKIKNAQNRVGNSGATCSICDKAYPTMEKALACEDSHKGKDQPDSQQ